MIFRFLRKISLRCALVVIGISVALLMFEIGLRVEHWYRKGTSLFTQPSERWDSELGWLGKKTVLGATEDVSGTLLVVGDSFTEGLTVAPDQMWYASLTHIAPGLRIVSYGGLGYGTLQELLVLQQLMVGYSPKAVILQICTNDLINNSFELEKKSALQRPPAPRPYRIDGATTIKFPRMLGSLQTFLIGNSRLAYRHAMKWETQNAVRAKNREVSSVEFLIQEKGFTYEPFRQSIATTTQLLKEFKEHVSPSPLFLFLIDDVEPYTNAIQGIAKNLNLPLVVALRRGIEPPNARLNDQTHYNEIGNKFLGEVLLNSLGEKIRLAVGRGESDQRSR